MACVAERRADGALLDHLDRHREGAALDQDGEVRRRVCWVNCPVIWVAAPAPVQSSGWTAGEEITSSSSRIAIRRPPAWSWQAPAHEVAPLRGRRCR